MAGGSSCTEAVAALQTPREDKEGAELRGPNMGVGCCGQGQSRRGPGQQGALVQQKSKQVICKEPAGLDMGLEVTKART